MLNTLGGLISPMSLSKRILEIVDAGYKKSAIARAAGKSPAAVTQWISGETKEIKSLFKTFVKGTTDEVIRRRNPDWLV